MADGDRTKVGIQTWFTGGILAMAIAGTGTAVRLYTVLTVTQDALMVSSERQGAALETLAREMMQMRYDLSGVVSDRWHMTDMRFWAQELQRLNANVLVPKVEPVENVRSNGR